MIDLKHNRILLDVETQRDLFMPGGSCHTPPADQAAKRVYRLFQWVRQEGIPVLSTVLRVRSGEIGPLADVPHLIDGTEGEQKLPRTVLPSRLNLGLRNTTDIPARLFDAHQQIIIEKRDTDLFAHARAERLITELPQATFVVCGGGLARSIAQAAIGLRSRGFGVILATDAVVGLEHPAAEMALLRMEAKGVVFAETDDIVKPAPAKKQAKKLRTRLGGCQHRSKAQAANRR